MASSLGNTVAFASIQTCDFRTTGKYLEWARAFAPEYEKEWEDAPGEDGVGVKRFGFRNRKIIVCGWYVNTGGWDLLMGNIKADFEALANAAFTTTLESGSYPGCELEMGSHDPVEALNLALVTFIINQKRLT